MLRWVLHATRPLRIAELIEAVSVEESTSEHDAESYLEADFVLECCMGLLTLQDDMVHFSHYTAQRFLHSHCEEVSETTYIANICLTYLLFQNLERTTIEASDPLEKYPLLEYAASNWMVHLRGQENFNPTTLQKVQLLLTNRGQFDLMLQARCIRNRTRANDAWPNSRLTSPLHLVARAGLLHIAKILINGDWGAEVCNPSYDSEERTALHEACNQSNPNITSLLINWNPTFVNSKDHEGRTPLHHAVRRGYLEVIKVLFDHNANANAKDNRGWDALRIALAWREDEAAHAVMDQLFKTASVSSQSDGVVGGWHCDGHTLLHQAAHLGHVPAVKHLLEAGADPQAQTWMGSTPLTFAARNGHDEVVEILLKAMNNVVKPTYLGATPLHRACQWGQEETVKVLLAADESLINAKTWTGFTPLHWAAAGGHAGLVKLLLDVKGIDLTREANVPTPLQLAAWGGWEETIRILTRDSYFAHDHPGLPTLDFDSVKGLIRQFNNLTKGFGRDHILPKRFTGGIELCHFYGITQMKAKRVRLASAWLDVALMIDPKNVGVKRTIDITCSNKGCDRCGLRPVVGPYYTCTLCVRPCFDLCSACHKTHSLDHAHTEFLKVPSAVDNLPTLEEHLETLKEAMERDLPGSIFGQVDIRSL